MVPVKSASIHYKLTEREKLSNFKQFIPENVLIGRHEAIGAIRNTGRYVLEKPFLLPQIPIIIDNLYVYLNPNVAMFESEFCRLVAEDKSMWDKLEIESSMISITERRLKIGVHNGWKFVHEPYIVQLTSNENSGPNKKRLNLKTSLKKASETDEVS